MENQLENPMDHKWTKDGRRDGLKALYSLLNLEYR